MSSSTPRFISLPEVSEITQLGKSTILAWEAQEKFLKHAAFGLNKTFIIGCLINTLKE